MENTIEREPVQHLTQFWVIVKSLVVKTVVLGVPHPEQLAGREVERGGDVLVHQVQRSSERPVPTAVGVSGKKRLTILYTAYWNTCT